MLQYIWVRLFLCVVCLAVGDVANAATLTLAWDPSSGPDVAGYVIYWGTQSGVYNNSLDVGNQTQQQVAGLADGNTFYFVLRAYNSAGMSPPSNEVVGQTPSILAAQGGCTSCSIHTDLNGDDRPDLLFQNDATRQVLVWYLTGPPYSILGWNWVTTADVSGWRLVATADFNGDGKPDLVWQRDDTRQVLVWYMGGSLGNTVLGWDWLATSGVEGWRLVDAVDLNRDGKQDLVWQNDATFQVVVWYMQGPNATSLLEWASLASSGVEGWRLMATGDFNRDGTPDLVWQNDARQTLVAYTGGSQGSVLQQWDWLSPWGLDGWTVVGTSDFNTDGTPDLVWQNDATRQVVVWFMGGSAGNAYQGSQVLTPMDVSGWTVVAR